MIVLFGSDSFIDLRNRQPAVSRVPRLAKAQISFGTEPNAAAFNWGLGLTSNLTSQTANTESSKSFASRFWSDQMNFFEWSSDHSRIQVWKSSVNRQSEFLQMSAGIKFWLSQSIVAMDHSPMGLNSTSCSPAVVMCKIGQSKKLWKVVLIKVNSKTTRRTVHKFD